MAIFLPTSYSWLKRGENILAVRKYQKEGNVLKKHQMLCARICDHTFLTFRKIMIVIIIIHNNTRLLLS